MGHGSFSAITPSLTILSGSLRSKISETLGYAYTLIIIPDVVPTPLKLADMARARTTTSLPNPSLQVTADHKLKVQDAPVYAPGRGEVLLHIKATGVCGCEDRCPEKASQC